MDVYMLSPLIDFATFFIVVDISLRVLLNLECCIDEIGILHAGHSST